MTSAQQRVYKLRAMLPPGMRERVEAVHAELNPGWINWTERGRTAPGRSIPISDREAPPDIHRPSVARLREIGRITQERGKVAPVVPVPVNPDPIAEMTCGEREYQIITCKKCGVKERATGSRQIQCAACKKKASRDRQRAWNERERLKAGRVRGKVGRPRK